MTTANLNFIPTRFRPFHNARNRHTDVLITDLNCNSTKEPTNRYKIIAINEFNDDFDVPSSFLWPSSDFYFFRANDSDGKIVDVLQGWEIFIVFFCGYFCDVFSFQLISYRRVNP
jgi:hypothetical protein